ncbi:LOW QUALITY PROTEIN: HBS1-like protein [Eucalyptus grandis]|uniref:LOW QUALITY PROTEIN: HBS1-like protein n=1 Tax=Eucalyptus grandis TaxID=71139 RepID=UPI00192ECB60|nr:LOW QUALITY PROTEIN: HBS1-like protein [Eucalyptus grandis]
MPRKFSHGLDYDDEDYDDDYDYDDDVDYDAEDNGNSPKPDQETTRSAVWRCSICTYDNDQSMTACDICGVLRNPLPSSVISNGNDLKTVCKDSGASKMARSLFESLPNQTPKRAALIQQQNDDPLTGQRTILHEFADVHGNFDKLHEAFNTRAHKSVNIVPFKFDVPSPDDVVTNGLHSSKRGPKASATVRKDNTSAPMTTRSSNSSSFMMSKGRNVTGNENNRVKDEERNLRSSAKSPDEMAGTSSSYHGGVEYTLPTDGIKPQSLVRSLDSVSINDRGGTGKGASQGQYKPEKWMLPEAEDGLLSQLNLAIVGHVDSGKSTLSGRLLHLLGRISQKEMHKHEKEAKLEGKGSFAYAWALDESPEERERGITMTVAVAYFDTKKYRVVVLDSPGHKDFVPNMISGATQADAALLVIDASIGSFEVGMDGSKGQTKEHAQLIRSFGVDQLIVAVNKMDVVEYSKDRFDLIKQQLGTFLRSSGFRDSSVCWIPLSAMENQNLVTAPSDVRLLSWYKGPYLLDAIDSLQPLTRDVLKPLVMPICDVIKSPSMGQVSACGKLEAGALRSGVKVLVMPSGDVGTVKSLERDSRPCAIARAGDNVAVVLQGIDTSKVISGGVLCHPDFPISIATHLELKVLVLDGASPILIGSQLEFHIHHAKEAARVEKMVSLLDPKTGKVMKKAPRCLLAKQKAVIEVVLQGPVCAEEFSSCKALGRVSLRALGRTIALGIVTQVIEKEP